MREELRAYFRGESRGAMLFVVAGLAAVAHAARLWRAGHPDAAAGWPLLLVGLLLTAVGGAVALRTPRQARGLLVRLVREPAALQRDELARMAGVMRAFARLRWLEAALAALGLAVLLLAPAREWRAAGSGLVAMALLALLLDAFAEARARRYVAALRAFLTDAGARPAERETGDVE